MFVYMGLQLFGSLLDTDDVRITNSLLPVCYHTLSAVRILVFAIECHNSPNMQTD